MNLIRLTNNEVFVTEEAIEVAKLMAQGLKTYQISSEMKINVRTLEAKIDRLKASVGAKTHAHLVAIFKDQKLI